MIPYNKEIKKYHKSGTQVYSKIVERMNIKWHANTTFDLFLPIFSWSDDLQIYEVVPHLKSVYVPNWDEYTVVMVVRKDKYSETDRTDRECILKVFGEPWQIDDPVFPDRPITKGVRIKCDYRYMHITPGTYYYSIDIAHRVEPNNPDNHAVENVEKLTQGKFIVKPNTINDPSEEVLDHTNYTSVTDVVINTECNNHVTIKNKDVFEDIKQKIITFTFNFTPLIDHINEALNMIVLTSNNVWGGIVNSAQAAVDKIVQTANNLFSSWKTTINANWGKIKSISNSNTAEIQATLNNIIDAFSSSIRMPITASFGFISDHNISTDGTLLAGEKGQNPITINMWHMTDTIPIGCRSYLEAWEKLTTKLNDITGTSTFPNNDNILVYLGDPNANYSGLKGYDGMVYQDYAGDMSKMIYNKSNTTYYITFYEKEHDYEKAWGDGTATHPGESWANIHSITSNIPANPPSFTVVQEIPPYTLLIRPDICVCQQIAGVGSSIPGASPSGIYQATSKITVNLKVKISGASSGGTLSLKLFTDSGTGHLEDVVFETSGTLKNDVQTTTINTGTDSGGNANTVKTKNLDNCSI